MRDDCFFYSALVHIVFLLDTSGHMDGSKIGALNAAMSGIMETLRELEIIEEVSISVRICTFSNDAEWRVGCAEAGVLAEDVDWADLPVTPGGTNMAAAIRLARECMHTKYLGIRAYKPLVILVTGSGSDCFEETKQAVEELRGSLKCASASNRDKIIRVAFGFAGANRAELECFASVKYKQENGVPESVPLVFCAEDPCDIGKLMECVIKNTVDSLRYTRPVPFPSSPVIIPEDDWED